MRRTAASIIAFLFVLVSLSFAGEAVRRAPSDMPGYGKLLIKQDLAAGKITPRQAALYNAQRVFRPSAMPERYQDKVKGPRTLCLSDDMREMLRDWDNLPEEGRQLIPQSLHPGVDRSAMLVRKGAYGRNALVPGPANAIKTDPGDDPGDHGWAPNFQFKYATANFLLHWSNTGPDALAQPADSNSNSVPDIVENTGQYLESARQWLLDHDYRAPVGTDSSSTPSYYENIYFAGPDYMGNALGFCWQVDWPAAHSASFIVLHSDMSGNGLWNGRLITPSEAVRVVCAHEYYHATQYAYDANEELWWIEATATWFMEQPGPAWDAVDMYTVFVYDFMQWPEVALDDNETHPGHEYAACVWPIFLQAHVEPDHDGSIIREIWEACEGPANALEANKSVLTGYIAGGFTKAFHDFLVANYEMDYPEAPQYPESYGALWYNHSVNSYPVNQHALYEFVPEGLGANYVLLRPSGQPGYNLNVSFTAGQSGWMGMLVTLRDSSAFELQDLSIGTVGSVNGFTTDAQEAVLIVTPFIEASTMPRTFSLSARLTYGDLSAPTPNPLTWQSAPHGTGPTAISMTATTATDVTSPPIQYMFQEMTGHDGGSISGWVASPTFVDSGLQANTQYAYRTAARDSAAVPNIGAWSNTTFAYTLANTPLAPVLSDPAPTKVYIAISDGDGNPAATQYAVRNDTTGTYVAADGSPSATKYFATRAAWAAIRIKGLTVSTPYTFKLIARNGDNIETTLGPGADITTLAQDNITPLVTVIATVPTWIKENITTSATLAATGNDRTTGGSDITAAEFFTGADPGAGGANPMTAADGAFDSPVESVNGTLNTTGWTIAASPYDVYVRVRDERGLWSAATLHRITVADATPPAMVANLAGSPSSGPSDVAATLTVNEATSETLAAPAANTVDGNAATAWATSPTDEPSNASITLNLDREAVYHKLTLTTSGRADLFPSHFKVKLSDGAEWWTVISEDGYTAGPGENTWQFAPRKATEIQIEIEDTPLDSVSSKYTSEIAEITPIAYAGGTRNVTLTWSAPSDAGPTGRAARYVVKWSTDKTALATTFAGTVPPDAPPTPGAPAAAETMNVSDLTPGTTYYFAVESLDGYDNASDMSNVATVSTLPDETPYVALDGPEDGKELDVATAPTFAWHSNLYDTFKVQFSNVPSFPSRPVKDAQGRAAATLSYAPKARTTVLTPSEAQWKAVKALAASMHGTLYVRVEGKSSRNAALGIGHSEVFNEYGFRLGDFLLADLTPYQLRNETKSIWPNTRPQFAWSVSDTVFSKYFLDFSSREDMSIYDKAHTVVVPCKNAARTMVPTWYKPSDADWKKIKKTLANQNGGLIYWRVRGLDLQGAFSFATAPMPLLVSSPAFTLRAPAPRADGTVEPGKVFSLYWIVDGDGYDTFTAQISTTDAFVKGATTINLRPTKTMGYALSAAEVARVQKMLNTAGVTTFYWRVTAADSDKTMTATSEAQAVTVSLLPAGGV